MGSGSLLPLLTALVSATAFASIVYVIMYPYISGDRTREKRLASVTESRAKKVATRSAAEITASRKKQVADFLKDLETRRVRKRSRCVFSFSARAFPLSHVRSG